MILKVFVAEVIAKKDKDGDNYYWVVGRLQSGMEVIVKDIYFDLKEHIGRHIEMLLSFTRSPYCELERGIHSQIFSPFKYYSVELVEELLSQKGVVSTGNERVIVLTGEYVDSYAIPNKWAPLTQRTLFKILYKEPSALKTEDGTFLLYPFHLQKQVPIEQFPREVTMAGGLRLEAWLPQDIN